MCYMKDEIISCEKYARHEIVKLATLNLQNIVGEEKLILPLPF